MSDNLTAIFEVLSHNSEDVEEIVRRFGGVGNLIRASPALFRIAKTIAAAHHPVEAAERTSQLVTYYDEATRERVKAFQQKHNLEADGIVGNLTWGAVEDALFKAEEHT